MEDLTPTPTNGKGVGITLVAKTTVLTDNIVLTSMFSHSLLPFDSSPLTNLILHLI